jgi:hypothetical protein
LTEGSRSYALGDLVYAVALGPRQRHVLDLRVLVLERIAPWARCSVWKG